MSQVNAADCLDRVGQWAHGPHYAVAATANHAFFANGGGITVVELSALGEPRAVSELSVVDGHWVVGDVEVDGDLVVAVANGLKVVDVSVPSAPVLVGSYTPPIDYVSDVALVGDLAYVAAGWSGLRILDLRDPNHPTEVGWVELPGRARRVAVLGDHAYVWDSLAVLRIIDVSVPSRPFVAASAQLPLGLVREIAAEGHYLYLAAGRLRIIDVSDPLVPDVVAEMETPGNLFGVDVADGFAYLAVDWGGLRVVDVNRAENPVEVGYLDQSSGESVWAVAVTEDVAWVADAYHGMRFVDVSVPSQPTQMNLINTRLWTHRLTVEGGFGYASGSSLRILRIGHDGSPVEVSVVDSPAADIAVQGHLAFVAAGEEGLRIVDVSNPAAPTEVAVHDTPGLARRVAANEHIVFVADGPAGLRLIDVNDPAAPFEVGGCDTPINATGVLVSGDLAYVADGEAGLRVIDVSDPTAPVEIGFLHIDAYVDDLALSREILLVAARRYGPRVIDVSDPTDPVEIADASELDYGSATAVALEGSYAYVIYDIPTIWGFSEYRLVTLGLSDPAAPILIREKEISSAGGSIVTANHRVYVAEGNWGVEVVASCAQPAPRRVAGRVGG